jgi:hypothetical protein
MTGSIPKNRNRYKVSEAKQQMIDKVGSDKLVIELDDGYILELPHPMFYDRKLKNELKAIDIDDAEGMLRVLAGDERADEFIEHGGDPDDLQYVYMIANEEMQDRLAGRALPTRS